MNYSIKEFWQKKLASIRPQSLSTRVTGWEFNCSHDDSYVEANLSLRKDFSDLSQSIWLIAAPGAVGKSTLAREICASSGAIYLDLANATTVAGNYLIGGLVHNNLYQAWQSQQTTVLIDALDEARLRVTQSSFEDFLSDIASVAKNSSIPLVLLGRVGIIEEAWTILNDRENLSPPIFDIELFDDDRAEQFVLARLAKLSTTTYPALASPLNTHRATYVEAIRRLIARLREVSNQDGNQFVGYAPVLDAIANVIATENNPAKIGDAMQRILEGKILDRLTSEILTRESWKLINQVSITIPNINTDNLYGIEEQLERLACKLFHVPPPPISSEIPQHAVSHYEQAVSNLLPQHPFLNGSATAPSGAVFGACIVAYALKSSRLDLAKAAEQYARHGHHAPNPFLFDFYRYASGDNKSLPAEHIGLLYESAIAKAEPGDIARLSVESEQNEGAVGVEISLTRYSGVDLRAEFNTSNTGTLRFGRKLIGITVDAEAMDVELGDGGQLELISPVSINAHALMLNCSEIVVKAESHTQETDNVVLLEAAELLSDPGLLPPTVRHGAQLQVSWPDSKAYPWSSFVFQSPQGNDPATADALRVLRRLIMSFRSHSKGRLARFKDKIEHARMMKGPVGEALLRKLLQDKVLSLEPPMYFLEPNILGEKVGISFLDAKLKRYSRQAIEYVQGLQ